MAAPLDPPARETVEEAQRIVQEMKQNPRGPYRRIRWFCNDGTTQAPVAFACREHGGGTQHAEYSQSRQRLAELGWPVGTIFTALDVDALVFGAARPSRLTDLALERYLIDIDNGWVLERAQGYRGYVQLEDEQTAGRALLVRLLSDSASLDQHFLLMRELARTVPHGEDSDLARRIRRAAIELAELEPAADIWRAEIHAAPDQGTAKRLRGWLRSGRPGEVVAAGMTLADDLDLLYGERGRRARTMATLGSMRADEASRAWRESVTAAFDAPPAGRVATLCNALADARSDLLPTLTASRRLMLLDVMQGLETETQLAFADARGNSAATRRELLELSSQLLSCAYGSGLLSAEERAYAAARVDAGAARDWPLVAYRNAIMTLRRVPGWATGTIRHTFADSLSRYTALDNRAPRFSDDLLRGSPLWMLGTTLRLLSGDLNQLTGTRAEIAGDAISTVLALNPGIARGTLRIYRTLHDVAGAHMSKNDVVVLPETIAELDPVAGILTLGEGNPVSHVQLLARNFAIPNVAIDGDTLELLAPLDGQSVVLAVGTDGNVVLRADDDATRSLLDAPGMLPAAARQVSVPQPDLAHDRILLLDNVDKSLSGRIVGPKAANLGELNRLFPGRVAPAVAIPFGVYADHVNRAGLGERIRTAFAQHADGTLDAGKLMTELAEVRTRMAALELDAATVDEIVQAMQQAFGGTDGYGVFIRSDTNVEDLPQFTGAGLNETLPNVVGLQEQLALIPRVWSSVLSPRALAWRSSVLANPDRIYASVLLMKSVPVAKSGVLVTTNIFDRDEPGMTASTAWGVGGAVAGEAAETLIVLTDNTELVTEAKAPYQRHLADSGGITWLPAPAGRVLTDGDVVQLRRLAVEVAEKYGAVRDENGNARPWDIEYGFIDGELTLFQIRPFVDRSNSATDTLIRALQRDNPVPPSPQQTVSLNEVVGGR